MCYRKIQNLNLDSRNQYGLTDYSPGVVPSFSSQDMEANVVFVFSSVEGVEGTAGHVTENWALRWWHTFVSAS